MLKFVALEKRRRIIGSISIGTNVTRANEAPALPHGYFPHDVKSRLANKTRAENLFKNRIFKIDKKYPDKMLG